MIILVLEKLKEKIFKTRLIVHFRINKIKLILLNLIFNNWNKSQKKRNFFYKIVCKKIKNYFKNNKHRKFNIIIHKKIDLKYLIQVYFQYHLRNRLSFVIT